MYDTTPQEDLIAQSVTKKRLKKTLAIVFGGLLLIVTGYVVATHPSSSSHSYVIPNVPYYGIYTYQEGSNGQYVSDTVESSVAIVLEYWNPDIDNLPEILTSMRTTVREGNFYDIERVAEFIDALPEYRAEVTTLSFDELKNYINADRRTPLIISLEMLPEAEFSYIVSGVLIGVSDDGFVTVHDHWLGNNNAMTIEEYRMFTGVTGSRGEYLIIQPENLNAVLAKVKTRPIVAYEPRKEVMIKTEDAFRRMYVGVAASLAGNHTFALEQFDEVILDPNYEEFFPPYYKMYLNSFRAHSYLNDGDIEAAREIVSFALELNRDLDKPAAGGWPGTVSLYIHPEFVGERYLPYVVLGNIRKETGDIDGAREAYERADAIAVGGNYASRVTE